MAKQNFNAAKFYVASQKSEAQASYTKKDMPKINVTERLGAV